MSRQKRTKFDLIKMEKHLIYEMKMIHKLADVIKEEDVQVSNALRSAVVESMGIHMRVLMEFFYDDNPRNKSSKTTNVLAADYYKDDSEWFADRKQVVSNQELDEAWKLCFRVNKEIIHLTWDRLDVDPYNRGWLDDWKRTFDVLAKAFQKFLKTVPDDNIGAQLREQRDRLPTT